jgi:hypothetical protein
VLVGAVWFLFCGQAKADPFTFKYKNPGPYQSNFIRVCLGGTCRPGIASVCGPGVTCSFVDDLPVGTNVITLQQAILAAGPWSDVSNAVTYVFMKPPPDPAAAAALACVASDWCRSDYDNSGTITGLDFGHFLAVFGKPKP